MGLMDTQWSDLCRMLSDAECKKTNTNNAWKPSLCNVLNFCVCGGLGEQSFHFQQNLVQLLRPFLRIPGGRKKQKTAEQGQNKDKSKAELRREKKTLARKMAEDGFLVLHFQLHDGDVETMHLENPSSGSSSSTSALHIMHGWSALAEVIAPSKSCKPSEFFFYIGFVNYSSYAFAGLELVRVANSGHSVQLGLPAKMRFKTSLQCWVDHVDFQLSWRMKACIIKSQNIPLSSDDMVPSNISVEPFAEIPEMVVWHGAVNEESKRMAMKLKKTPAKQSQRPGTGRGRGSGSSKKRKTDQAELEQAHPQGPQPEVPEHLADIYGDDEVLNFANPLQDEESESEEDQINDFNDDVEVNLGSDSDGESKAEEMKPGRGKRSSAKGQRAGVQKEGVRKESPPSEPPLPAPAGEPHLAGEAHPAGEPPPPEPPRSRVVTLVGRKKSGTEVKLDLGDVGAIHFYPKTCSFTAFCNCPRHEDCRKSRTGKPSASRPSQGRPLGYLTAWLQQSHDWASRYEHVHCADPTQQACVAGRKFLHDLGGVDDFFQYERPRHPGESDEPNY